MKMLKRTVGMLLCLAMLAGCCTAAFAAVNVPVPEGYQAFFRVDTDSFSAWEKDLGNVRLITEGRYQFKKLSSKYGLPEADPDRTGMDTLNISGSAEFSEAQFRDLSGKLRECAQGKKIYVVDLRRESHALVNGVSFQWYGFYNWSNQGLSTAEVEADEAKRFGALVGSRMTGRKSSGNKTREYDVTSVMTERQLVEREGFEYVRIPVLDHTWPTPEEVDEFVEFVKGIDMENSWLHFHCAAGRGRTGEFMMMYDKMKNPQVPMMDILIRQSRLGGTYPLYVEADQKEYKRLVKEEKAEMVPLFFRYVDENIGTGYAVKWSEWLKAQGIGAGEAGTSGGEEEFADAA